MGKKLKNAMLQSLFNNLYLIWGAVVVGVIFLATGAIIGPIIAYTLSVGGFSVIERFF